MTARRSLATHHARSHHEKTLCILAATLAAATFAGKAAASRPHGKRVSIQMPQAREIAFKACPGKTAKEELEQEKGGSGLRYSFGIANGTAIHEAGVDAITGKLLENSVERADND